MVKESKNMIGAAGEYFVCAELSKRNILALLTPKNNPLFDVVASLHDGRKSIPIQVKTMSMGNKQGWRLSMEITERRNNPDLHVVLVNLKANEPNDYYIFQYDDLSDKVNAVYQNYISTPKKDNTSRKDVQFRWFDLANFTDEDRLRKNDWSFIIDYLNN